MDELSRLLPFMDPGVPERQNNKIFHSPEGYGLNGNTAVVFTGNKSAGKDRALIARYASYFRHGIVQRRPNPEAGWEKIV